MGIWMVCLTQQEAIVLENPHTCGGCDQQSGGRTLGRCHRSESTANVQTNDRDQDTPKYTCTVSRVHNKCGQLANCCCVRIC